jgi:hypothetical protein
MEKHTVHMCGITVFTSGIAFFMYRFQEKESQIPRNLLQKERGAAGS